MPLLGDWLKIKVEEVVYFMVLIVNYLYFDTLLSYGKSCRTDCNPRWIKEIIIIRIKNLSQI